MSDFYLTLSSSASMTHFPDNKITSFKNSFGEPVRLEDGYEVALVECSYVHSGILLHRGDVIGKYMDTGTAIECSRDLHHITEIETMLKELEDENHPILLRLAYTTNGDIYYVQHAQHILYEPRLQNMLGYSKSHDSYYYKVFPQALRTQLYFYCSIVSPQRVGHEVVPLLRRMTYVGKHNEIITRSFPHLQYVDVAFNDFDTIWLYVRHENGDHPAFTAGTLDCTLHFRRKRA
jgi:hypothetical protein